MADVGVDDLPLHLSAQILLQRNEAAHALDDERRAARLALNLHAAVVVTALGKIAVVGTLACACPCTLHMQTHKCIGKCQ